MKYQKRKAIAAKIAEKTHTSVKDTIKSTFPYVQVMMQKDKTMKKDLAEFFDLDKEEVAWMVKWSIGLWVLGDGLVVNK